MNGMSILVDARHAGSAAGNSTAAASVDGDDPVADLLEDL